jgi:leucyl-tRNA synthetase
MKKKAEKVEVKAEVKVENKGEDKIDFSSIEKKWQKEWEEKKVFHVNEDSKKKKYYVLEMFPYPSASGLHMGHALNYTIGDIFARFKRMNGFNVLYPMGYDAFGLPAENAAIKAGAHPKPFTEQAMTNYIRQMKEIGLSYDWSRIVKTCDSEYYKWNQYFFLKFFENGLVYRKKSAVNWCPKCTTVLANEQVHSGKCWRHEDTDVELKQLEQWFIKTTKYSEELLEKAKDLQWPERIKIMQENWIGKSFGTEIDFEIFENIKDKEFVFLHAYGDNMSNAFWSWLKKEIEARGGKVVFAQDLPNTNKPQYAEQSDFVTKNYKFNEKSIVIGHSLGNILIMKLLSSGNLKINKLIMVAPPFPKKEDILSGKAFKDNKSRPALADYCDWKFDFSKIKKSVDQIEVLIDKKDYIVPDSQPLEIAKQLEASITEAIGNRSHYNGETEEEVLNLLFPKWPIFTTRADTIYGVTFMVVSAQHSRLMELVTKEQKKKVEDFLKKLKSVSEKELEEMDKEGVFTGSYAINPITKEKVPVWVGNFVVADYGSGMVMAVPTHDQRDFEFAKKYNIPMKVVIQPKDKKLNEKEMTSAYTDEGVLINSDKFNGMNNKEAIEKISEFIEKQKLGKKTINYKFRDWLVSRQRYWGTPIPFIYCDTCGVVPVPEKDLPVLLPEKVEFGKGNPLATNKEFVNTKCPKCKENAKRETDTMDTFFDSSWYYLRYCDNKNNKEAFDKKKVNYWMPVDQYIGGAEHACMHLIYARFFTKALRDMGLLKFDEPFIKLFNQGMLHGSDGEKMSKSKGNVILPEEVSKKYGMDTARLFLMSQAAPDKDTQWSETGIDGSFRIVKRIISFFENNKIGKSSEKIQSKLNKTIKEFTEDIENFRYNYGIIKLRDLFEGFEQEKEIAKEDLESFLKILHPFCPHITEELWHKLGNKTFLSLEAWPKADESKINDKFEQEEKNLDKAVSDIVNVLNIIKQKTGKEGNKIYLYVMPFELASYNSDAISKRIGKEIKVFAVNDKNKYDPEGKASKAKPGKPGIFIE